MILHFALDPALSFDLHHISYCPKEMRKKKPWEPRDEKEEETQVEK
jgi:hypothetical protein